MVVNCLTVHTDAAALQRRSSKHQMVLRDCHKSLSPYGVCNKKQQKAAETGAEMKDIHRFGWRPWAIPCGDSPGTAVARQFQDVQGTQMFHLGLPRFSEVSVGIFQTKPQIGWSCWSSVYTNHSYEFIAGGTLRVS